MKRILPYLKPYRGKMLLGMLLIAVSSVCSLLLPTIMSDILDGGIYTSDWDYILRCCGRMLLVTLLSLGAVAAGTWCRTQVVSGFCADLRTAVFGRVNALTFEEVSRIGTSALLTRSTHDVGTLAWVADMLSSNIITIPVLFFGGVVLAFSKDSTLALIILVAMPIITLLVLAIGRRVEPLWKISDQFCDKQNDLVRERLHGIRVIRAFNREEQEQGRIAEATRVMAEHIIEANTKMGLVAPIAIALMNLVAVAILYFGGSRMQSGISAASGGDIFAMVQYVALVMNGIVMAAFALVMYPHAKAAAGGNRQYYVFVVPIAEEVDLKAAAKCVGEKSLEMLHVKDLTPLTGYVRGGCSPLGMKKQFPTVVHESAASFDKIYISGGRVGTSITVNPDALLKVTRGQYADIIQHN